VKKASFSQDEVEYSEHQKWVSKKLESKDCKIFIFTLYSQPIGQVRFEINQNNIAEIDISIDKDFRKKGFASKILTIASKFAITDLEIRVILSHIRLDNEKSLR